MAVQLKSPEQPAIQRRAAPVDVARRAHYARELRTNTAPKTQASSFRTRPRINVPRSGPAAALWLLLIFVVALSVMVGAIAVLAVLDAWWVLVAVVVLDLIVTAVVLVSIAWIVTDGERST